MKSLKQILADRLEFQIKMEENPIFKDAYLNYWFKLTSQEISYLEEAYVPHPVTGNLS